MAIWTYCILSEAGLCMCSETSEQTYYATRYSNQGECRLKFFFICWNVAWKALRQRPSWTRPWINAVFDRNRFHSHMLKLSPHCQILQQYPPFFSDALYSKFVSHPLVLIFRIFTTAATNVWFDFTVGEGHVLMLWISCVLCSHEARNYAIFVFVRGLLCDYG
jgi:hypothetical protein